MATSLFTSVRITTRRRAVWRECAACASLCALAPDETHCPGCRTPARATRRPLAA